MSEHLAAKLQHILTEQNMSAAELARLSGVSMASLSRILAGTVNPSFGNMEKIAAALGVSLDVLASSVSNIKQKSPAASRHTAVEGETYIHAVFALPDTDKSPKEAAMLLENAAKGTWVTTWAEQFVDPNIAKPYCVQSKQVGTRRVEVELAFPHTMFETGSITGLLSVLSAAVTSTGARLIDVDIPPMFIRTYTGPAFGVSGLRDRTAKYGRPLLSTTLRPMLGLSPKVYGRAVFEALKGGIDFTCDPTLMHDIPGNGWKERFRFVAEAVHSAGSETSEYKDHAANVTAGTLEQMFERVAWAKELELGMVLVDSAAIGWTALQSLSNYCRQEDLVLCAMGSRALAGGILSEQLEAKLLRLVGCDMASMGSPLKGSVVQRRLSVGTVTAMRDQKYDSMHEGGLHFKQDYTGHASTLPAVGGGHNPWHFPRLIDALGDDTLIQCGGSVMGHPWGSAAGATANRVAIESLIQARGEGQSLSVDGRNILQKAQRYSPELKAALEFWQEGAFLFGVIMGDQKTETPSNIAGTIEGPESKKTVQLRSISTEEDE